MKPKLEKWLVFGDTVVGYIFDSKEFEPGTHIQTGVKKLFNSDCTEVSCADGDYRLGAPGTYDDHNGQMALTGMKRSCFTYLKGRLYGF